MKTEETIKNTSCFSEHKKFKIECEKRDCRYWINGKQFQNCSLIGAKKGPLTLQEIGDIFSVTRMRICQIEKVILDKVNNKLKQI